MLSRRLLRNIATQATRFSSQKGLSHSVTVRSSFVLNQRALPATANNSISFFQRQYNSRAEPSSFRVVDYKDIQSLIKNSDKSYKLIDVREQKEVIQGAIPTAQNIPLSQFANAWSLSDEDFQQQFGFEKPKKEENIVLYCLGGVRSTRAAEHLASLGYDNLSNYVGSWADYVEKQKGV